MTALLFTLALLLAGSLPGLALATWLRLGSSDLERVLLAPALGLACVLLPTFFLNRLGLPVADFALPMVGTVMLLSLVLLRLRRPRLPWRSLLPPMAIVLIAGLLVGWPMARFGFDWISYANDDMANYALAAQRFLQHGFTERPDLPTFLSGRDYSLAYWFMHVATGARPGPELVLATLWGVTGLNAHQLFMPTIVALHMALVAATGATVAGLRGLRRRGRVAAAAMALLAISPLASLGTLYQLIAQVGGLALTMATLTLLCQPPSRRWRREASHQVAVVLLASALLVWYPEVVPFLGASWLCWMAVTAWRACRAGQRCATRQRLVAVAGGALALLIVLGSYVPTMLRFLVIQSHQGLVASDADAVQFPFYMVPHGFAYFWGLLPLGFFIPEPLLSGAILAGMVLSAWLLVRLWRLGRQGAPTAIMSAVMVAVGATLYYRGNDFGLYKLAMFLQPAVAACLALSLASRPLHWSRVVALGLLLAGQAPAQFAYALRSNGDRPGTLTELPRGSHDAIARRFEAFMRSLPAAPAAGYYADTSNVVLAKIQSLYTQGTSVVFPAKDYYWPGERLAAFADANGQGDFWRAGRQAHADHLAPREIDLGQGIVNRFGLLQGEAAIEGRTLLAHSTAFGIFNRFGQPDFDAPFRLMPQPRNHLMFIDSSLGAHYYQGRKRGDAIALYQLEEDPMFPGRQMAGVGRHLLMLAAGVTDRPRMMIELTDTVLRQHDSALPAPVVHGLEPQAIPFVGRGSGRLLSQPLEPIRVGGQAFFHLDLGRDGKLFQYAPTSPVTGLFGRHVPLDNRFLTAFARNISLLSEEQSAALVPPAALSAFPADLAQESLQYSGIYEDGWVSERALFVLQPRTPGDALVLRGMVPLVDRPDFRSTMTLRVDGREVAHQVLGLGDYAIKIPLPPGAGSRRIELAFDRTQVLPGGDGRPTGGLVRFIGFVKE